MGGTDFDYEASVSPDGKKSPRANVDNASIIRRALFIIYDALLDYLLTLIDLVKKSHEPHSLCPTVAPLKVPAKYGRPPFAHNENVNERKGKKKKSRADREKRDKRNKDGEGSSEGERYCRLLFSLV